MLSQHRLRRRVQFYETDAAGIVHFSWYFRYIEEAEHALWREAGLSAAPPHTNVHWPRVSASCEFLGALRFEEEFDVAIRVAAMTRRTIQFAAVITRGATRIATGRHTIVCAQRLPDDTMQSIEIPPDIAGRLEVGAADES